MDHRQEVNVKVAGKQTSLHLGVKIGNAVVVQNLLRRRPSLHAEDEHGWQPLHYAGRLQPTWDKRTVTFHNATGVDRAKIVDLLCKEGAETNVRTLDDEQTPLHIAARFGALAVIRSLLSHGADPLLKDVSGRSPLDMIGDDATLESGLLKIIAKELEQAVHAEGRQNWTVDELEDDGLTELHLLCVDYLEVENRLLSQRFDPTQIFRGDSAALMRLACLYPNPTANGLRRKLLQMGFSLLPEGCMWDYDEPLESDLRPVHQARQLLDAGAVVNARTMRQRLTPLHIACAWGSEEMVDLLVAYGADVNAISGFGYTPLDVVELSQNGVGDQRWDKLQYVKGSLERNGGVYASSLPHVAVPELQMALRRRFGDTTIKWESHVPNDLHPLHGACVLYQNLAAVFILNGLAPASAYDGDRAALVHHACIHVSDPWHGLDLRRVRYLGDAYGLESRVSLEHLTEVSRLLMSIDANVCTHTGITPLHLAGMYGTEDIIELLVKQGAEPNAISVYGTPLDLIDTMLNYTTGQGEKLEQCSCVRDRAAKPCRHLEYPKELASRRKQLERYGAKKLSSL